MSAIFFGMAIFWACFTGYDYGIYGASHDFWVDVFMIFFCLFFAIWTGEANK
tara:strand:+ start:308 stop:463 length:156 start_codon:yes stop_codon:yes gene_type:complete